MNQINVPSRNAVATNDKQARAIQDLYSYISEWKQEVDLKGGISKAELAAIIASISIDEESGDITIEYDDGTTVNNNE